MKIKLTEKRSSREPIEVTHADVRYQYCDEAGYLNVVHGTHDQVYPPDSWQSFEVVKSVRSTD